MPNFERKVMCDECPFRKKALRGWLGPHSIEDIEKVVHSEEPFICHKSIAEMIHEGIPEGDPQLEVQGQHCVGMLRYRTAVCKLSRDPEVYQVQQELKTVLDQSLIAPFKFREHHEKLPFEEKAVEGIMIRPVDKTVFPVKHKPVSRKSDK